MEKWLLQVEQQMVASLRSIISRATKAYYEGTAEEHSDEDEDDFYSRWVMDWPGQAVITARAIVWTAGAVEAIAKASEDALGAFLALCRRQLAQVVALVRRGGLTPRARTTLRSLIVASVHSRDVIERAMAEKVASVADFGWTSQLRYYLPDLDDGAVKVNRVPRYVYNRFTNKSPLGGNGDHPFGLCVRVLGQL